jgi:mRNA-degrading endonuclease RelE of RelBE toxin-antitoxin system
MQIKFIFTKKSEKIFNKLDNNTKNRIIKKLKYLKEKSDLSNYIKKLENMLPATHRIRV